MASYWQLILLQRSVKIAELQGALFERWIEHSFIMHNAPASVDFVNTSRPQRFVLALAVVPGDHGATLERDGHDCQSGVRVRRKGQV